MKKIASIILFFAFVFSAGINLVGCNLGPEIETYGDFLYSIEPYDENGQHVNKKYAVQWLVRIQGLSEAGKEKENIVVPEYINGVKVKELGSKLIWGSGGEWESEKLQKVFIPFPVVMYMAIFARCNALKKIILLAHDTSAYQSDGSIYNSKGLIPVYFTSFHYSEEEYTTNFFASKLVECYFSNISFWFNYDNAPNDGYYWIDDCSYGSRIKYIPESPVRDGYTFDGWYKQAECVNKWNFELDTLPQAQYNEDNEEIYQETKLYAKWIEN